MLLEIWYVHDGQAVRSIAFDRNGERILTASDDRTANIWPIQSDRSRLLQEAFTAGRRICRRTPGTPEWSDVWRWCPADLAD
jgi:WD40 repeat protein